MIIIDRPKLRFLLAGRTIQIDETRSYRKGRVYPLGVSRRSAVCRIVVVDLEPLESGWRVTIKRAAVDEPPMFLARDPAGMRRDYTPNPAKAARDSTGAIRGGRSGIRGEEHSRVAAERDDGGLERRTALQIAQSRDGIGMRPDGFLRSDKGCRQRALKTERIPETCFQGLARTLPNLNDSAIDAGDAGASGSNTTNTAVSTVDRTAQTPRSKCII